MSFANEILKYTSKNDPKCPFKLTILIGPVLLLQMECESSSIKGNAESYNH